MISALKNAVQLIRHNLDHLMKETRLTQEQSVVLTDCIDKAKGVEKINVPLYEPGLHDTAEMKDLMS
jgi:hypothetical protein